MLESLKNNTMSASGSAVDRRGFLKTALIAACSIAVPSGSFAALEDVLSSERELFLHNFHTDEILKRVYCKNGEYVPDALAEINNLFRDVRTGTVKSIDTGLLDLLFAIRKKLNTSKPFQIVSGYRTPRTNAMLRKKRKGVARNSLHMYGKAADIRMPGYSLKAVRGVAMKLKGGGVGYYPGSKFLHIDVGKIRYWWG